MAKETKNFKIPYFTRGDNYDPIMQGFQYQYFDKIISSIANDFSVFNGLEILDVDDSALKIGSGSARHGNYVFKLGADEILKISDMPEGKFFIIGLGVEDGVDCDIKKMKLAISKNDQKGVLLYEIMLVNKNIKFIIDKRILPELKIKKDLKKLELFNKILNAI